MTNPRKNKIIREIWTTPKEFNELIESIANNNNEMIVKIMKDIYFRGDIN